MPPDDDPLRDTTRELRRTMYLADAIEACAADAQLALASDTDPRRALLAALHLHIGRAWDAGAGREADLRSALDVARATIERLRRIARDLQRRVSAER